MPSTVYKQKLLSLLEEGKANEFYSKLEDLRGAYAVAFVLNALSEDEITENGAKALKMLKQIIDPRNDRFYWNG